MKHRSWQRWRQPRPLGPSAVWWSATPIQEICRWGIVRGLSGTALLFLRQKPNTREYQPPNPLRRRPLPPASSRRQIKKRCLHLPEKLYPGSLRQRPSPWQEVLTLGSNSHVAFLSPSGKRVISAAASAEWLLMNRLLNWSASCPCRQPLTTGVSPS